MAERLKAAVSKTVVGASSTVGSNPTLSAIGPRSADVCASAGRPLEAGIGDASAPASPPARRGAGAAERARLEIV